MKTPRVSDHVLAIGFNIAVSRVLETFLCPRTLTALEEHDLYRRKRVDEHAAGLSCVSEILLTRYQQADDYLAAAVAVHKRRPVRAVMTSFEYSVEPAAHVAETLGLPGLSRRAATILRDKLQLRELAAAAGILCPAWAELSSADDIRSFVGDHGNAVVKPANRQAGIGVQLVDERIDADAVWDELLSLDEGVHVVERPLRWRYLVESRLRGREFSAEVLVTSGQIIFLNVTEQLTLTGPRPIKLGHTVPAPIDEELRREFRAAMTTLAAITGARDGMLHAEWILTSRGLELVECAGRPPGDFLMEMIGYVYGFDPWRALIDILRGSPPVLPSTAERVATVRFVTPRAGRIIAVRDVQPIRDLPYIERVELSATIGANVPELRSAWDRSGYAICTAPTTEESRARAAAAAAALAGAVSIESPDAA